MVTTQPLCGLLIKRPGQTSFEHKLDLVFTVKALASHQQNHNVFHVTLMHLHTVVIMLLYILLACIELCGIKRWSLIAVMNCQAVVMLIKQLGWQQKQRLPSLCSCRRQYWQNKDNLEILQWFHWFCFAGLLDLLHVQVPVAVDGPSNLSTKYS